MTIYNILDDWKALESLVDGMTDPETGETREFTEEEKAGLLAWADETAGNLEAKIDGICKVYRNKRAESEVAGAEKNALGAEIDRLRKREKARLNEADRVKSLIIYAFDRLKLKKYKTNLFTAYFQAVRKTAKPYAGFFDPGDIPAEFLKRELSPSAVENAVKEGRLYEKEEPQHGGKLFYLENGEEKYLKGVSYTGGETLVIR